MMLLLVIMMLMVMDLGVVVDGGCGVLCVVDVAVACSPCSHNETIFLTRHTALNNEHALRFPKPSPPV